MRTIVANIRRGGGRTVSYLLAVFVLILLAAPCAKAEINLPAIAPDGFARGIAFTVDGYAKTEDRATLTNFPVLVRISSDISGFNYTDCLLSEGADIRFLAADGTLLPHEIEKWDVDGESLVWVALPRMTNGTEFAMVFGAGNPGPISADDVWANYVAVIHGGDSITNSVAGGQAATAGSADVTAEEDAGKVGGGIRKSSNNSIGLNIAQPAAKLTDTGKFSVSGWFKRNGNGNSGTHILSASRSAWNTDDGYLCLQEKGKYIDVAARNSHQWSSGNFTLADKIWGHVAFSYEKNVAIKSYFNGAADQTKTSPGNLVSSIDIWTFGSYANKATTDAFKGDMDELRIYNGVASGDWIKAEYDTVAVDDFLSAGMVVPFRTGELIVGLTAPSADIGCTNATLAVSVASLGTNAGKTADASWVDPRLVVSTHSDMSNPLYVLPLSRVSSVPATIPVPVVPLVTNTTYYAQLLATNSFNVAGESGIISFTTLNPGAPAGTAAFVERGFSTMDATATVTSFGIGGESANIRLEASADGFETVVAGVEQVAVLDSVTQISVANLAADTLYSLRARVRNDWGFETYLPLPDAYTRAVPFATTGFGWQFSQDGSTIDITFGVSGVYDGAEGTATLTYDGRSCGEREVSSDTILAWSGIASAAGSSVVSIVLTAELNGQTYTQTNSATITAGSSAVSVTDIEGHVSVATAILVHPGDVVTLPELSGSDSYIIGNRLFASLEGNILTALRAGILGIHCVTESGATTNTVAVIVLPEKIGDGDIFIYDETATSGNGNWNNSAQWRKIGSETRDSYPNKTNDIAMIPYYSSENRSLNLSGDITIGAIFFGGIRDVKTSAALGTNNSSYKRKITFARTDGKPILLQCCSSGSVKDRTTTLTINGSMLVDYTGDAVISGGWDGRDAYATQGRITFGGASTIPEDATVTFVEFDSAGTSNNRTLDSGTLSGGGTLWNRSAANIKISGNDDLANFTGLLRDSSHGNLDPGRSGPIFVRTPSATNTLYELVGFVARNSNGHAEISATGVGRFYTGWEPGYGSTYYGETNWFPACGLVMHGGSHYSRATENAAWGVGGRERKVGARLTVADGFNYLYESQRTQKDGHPINWLEYNALNHENKATLLVRDPTRYSAPETEYTNVVTILHGWDTHAVGPAGNPESSDSYPIVPWVVSPLDSGNTKFFFASFDSTDRLVCPAVAANNTPLSDFSAGCNAYCRNGGIALTEDLTVNSLYLQNDAKVKTLGVGRTLTVTSGGLILSDVDDNNNTGAAAIGEEGGSENGALVLGDADHPAYVWACGADIASGKTAPNEIWAEVTAPGGFVAAHTGALILGGDQTGIRDEIAVNAGTLQLGTAESTCSLATELPIRIFANATLKLPNDSSATGNIVKFDGAAGWFGKVEVPAGVAAKCKKAYWRDYPGTKEWQELKRGVYGSSESGAPNVRDDLFVGAGTLQILRDDSTIPFVILVR